MRAVVTVGGVTVTGQFLSAVTKESSQLSQEPTDGVLGLAWPSISELNSVRATYPISMFRYHSC